MERSEGTTRPRGPGRAVLLAGGVLLLAVGLAVGYVLPRGSGGDTTGTSSAPALTATPSSSTSSSTSSTPGSSPSTSSPSASSTQPVGRQDVPAACVRAGEGAQEALEAIDEAGDAVADLDARRLDQLIDGLLPLRQQLPVDVAACRSAAAL